MAKKKTQTYEVYHLVSMKESGLYEPIAVFTSQKAGEKYILSMTKVLKDGVDVQLEPHTTEVEPVSSNFNVPLDPEKFVLPVAPKVKGSKVKETRPENALDPKSVSKDEPVSALLGLKVGRKGGAGNSK